MTRLAFQGYLELADADEVEWTVELLRPRLAGANNRTAQVALWTCDPLVQLGRLALARGHADAARTVFQRLADADPRNAQAQRDLWVSHWKVADLAERAGDATQAGRHWRMAHAKLVDMKQRGLHLSPQDEGFLAQLKEKVGG